MFLTSEFGNSLCRVTSNSCWELLNFFLSIPKVKTFLALINTELSPSNIYGQLSLSSRVYEAFSSINSTLTLATMYINKNYHIPKLDSRSNNVNFAVTSEADCSRALQNADMNQESHKINNPVNSKSGN